MSAEHLRRRLAKSRLYLCVGARPDLAVFLEEVLSAGVDIVQFRDKSLSTREELAQLEIVAEACARHGALFAVNDRADVAQTVRADILHLGQDDLPVHHARRIVGEAMIIGRSIHSPAQADRAAVEPSVDYFCAGPCWPTPTKPGRPATGLSLLAHVRKASRPWFAIGGIDPARTVEVVAAGANRIVVVRALTEARDPGAATRALLAGLPSVD